MAKTRNAGDYRIKARIDVDDAHTTAQLNRDLRVTLDLLRRIRREQGMMPGGAGVPGRIGPGIGPGGRIRPGGGRIRPGGRVPGRVTPPPAPAPRPGPGPGVGPGAGLAVSRLGMRALSVAGGLYIGGRLAGYFADVNNEVEQGVAGIQALMMAIDGVDAAAARSRAGKLFESLRKDAAVSIGSLDDYRQFASIAFSPLRQAGADDERIRRITRLGVTSGFALRGAEGAGLMGLDVQQALTSGIGDKITKDLNIALRAAGVDLETFNDRSMSERLDLIDAALTRFAASADEFGKTWEAVSATTSDNFRELARNLTGPAFEGIKAGLFALNDEFNRETDERKAFIAELSTLGGILGDTATGLAKAAGRAVDGASETADMYAELNKKLRFLLNLGPGDDMMTSVGRTAAGGVAAVADSVLSLGMIAGMGMAQAEMTVRGLGKGPEAARQRAAFFRVARLDAGLGGPQIGGLIPAVPGWNPTGRKPESWETRGLPEYAMFEPRNHVLADPLERIAENTDPESRTASRAPDYSISFEWGNDRRAAAGIRQIIDAEVARQARFPTSGTSRIPRPSGG